MIPYSQNLQQIVIVLNGLKLLPSLKIVFLVKMQLYGDILSLKSLLGDLILAVLGIRLAHLSEDPITMNMNTTSLVLNITFLVNLYRYALPEYKLWIRRNFLLIVMLICLCLWYSILEDPMTVKCSLSIFRTGMTSLLIVMGLLQRTGDVLGCSMSLLRATSKLLYALSILNRFMVYQSLFVLCLVLLRYFYMLHYKWQCAPSNISESSPTICVKDLSTTELKGVSTEGSTDNEPKKLFNNGHVKMSLRRLTTMKG